MTGNELKAWRKAKAFDGQAAAAATFGVALRTYQRWEQLKQKPVDKVVALACQAVDLKAALDTALTALDAARVAVHTVKRAYGH